MAKVVLYNSDFSRRYTVRVGTAVASGSHPGNSIYNIDTNIPTGTYQGFSVPNINDGPCSNELWGDNCRLKKQGTWLSSLAVPNSTVTYYLLENNTTKRIEIKCRAAGELEYVKIYHNATKYITFSFSFWNNTPRDFMIVFMEGTAANQYSNVTMWCTAYLNGRQFQGCMKNTSSLRLYTALHVSMSDDFQTIMSSHSLIIGDNANPYSENGYSEEGGGEDGGFGEDSGDLDLDDLPDENNMGGVAIGLVSLFTPTKGQLQNLSNLLWSRSFWQFLQNAVENIEDLLVSLAMVPFQVPVKDTVEVTWFGFETGVNLTRASKQFVEFNFGSISFDGSNSYIWNSDSVYDYSPYSKLSIYLPFIGTQELDIDECRGKTLTLIYRIDIMSGSVLAAIKLNGDVFYQFTGNCLTQIPLTSMDAQTVFTNSVAIATSAASLGATAAVASAGDAAAAEKYMSGSISATGAEYQAGQHAAQVSSARGSLESTTMNSVMGMKPNFKKSGALGNSCAMVAAKTPCLFITTPTISLPENYQKFCGFPLNVYGTIGSHSGFVVVEDIRLNGLVATSVEVEEIYELLKSGVIV